ncbi:MULTISPECIES: heme-binding protein [unclassified Bradyrhizobium]|uniref:heme-binding protein n=1 Tax=unclassified Bradyrhizobium TaxID=2631580 RepID=UPI002FEE7B8B
MYVGESKPVAHQGAKKIMTSAVDMASQAGIAIASAIVDAGAHMILLERMDGGRGAFAGEWPREGDGS